MTTSLVTGATRGIGREITRRLVDAGHTVYLGARDAGRGEEAAAALGARDVRLDVTDADSVTAAAERIRAEAGRLDVLINNAGIAGAQRPPAEATIDDMQAVFDTNVIGAARVLGAFAALLDESATPVVVNVSSAVGSLTRNAAADSPWRLLAYPMSKAALNMLTIQYAKAYPRWRVNSATPGLTATDFSPNFSGRGVTVEQGADVLVRMATIGVDGPTGTFVDVDGTVPW